MLRPARLAPAVVALLALAACSDPILAPTAAEPGGASLAKRAGNTTSRQVATCDGGSISLNADEARELELHNLERTAAGLRTFCVSPALTSAARAHAQEMMSKGYFSHDSYNGEPFYLRLQRYGYTGGSKAENIAWGSGGNGTPDQIFIGFKWSSGHYANIVNPYLSEIGVGVSSGRYSGYDNVKMYTVDFGAP